MPQSLTLRPTNDETRLQTLAKSGSFSWIQTMCDLELATASLEKSLIMDT